MSPACEYPFSFYLPSFPHLCLPHPQPYRSHLTNADESYFCREYLEGYFLNHPVHSRYIDAVGGVRIEDDILVTEGGHENLTSAPKGEEMLRVINGE